MVRSPIPFDRCLAIDIIGDVMSDPKDRAKQANRWLSSDEGRSKLEDALRKCRERIEELKKLRRLDKNQADIPIEGP